MLVPLIVAFVAVALGTWLALGPREGAAILRPIRLIALGAAALVIVTHLLPEAFQELGYRAVLGFFGGLAIPTITERVQSAISTRMGAPSGTNTAAGIEIAYTGLVVHRFGDGLSMGAYSRADHGAWAQLGVVLTLALHIVPVTTVMILGLALLRGRRAALVRGAILALSTMAGVVTAGLAVAGGPKDVSPWISAVVAGLLLHIVAHDVPGLTSAGAHDSHR